jgi:hypothetical protein
MACGHGPGTLFNSLTKPRIYCCPSQPIQALEHPKFKDMIDFASRVTNGVKIPGQKVKDNIDNTIISVLIRSSETGSCLGIWTQQRKEGRGTGPVAW